MKLNKYIYKMLNDTWPTAGIPTEEAIEDWIVEWYRSEFNEVGCDGPVAKSRMPPSWLAKWRRE